MTRRACLPLLFAAASLTACDIHFEEEPVEELASICEPVIFENTALTHCRADPAAQTIGTDLSPEGDDSHYGSLRAFAEAERGSEKPQVVLAMNGGMFDDTGHPIGYFVEDGRRLTVLNQRRGDGEFYLRPNGVFFGQGPAGPWFVWPTARFAAENAGRPDFATQSGPMLVIEGELHPDIAPDGAAVRLRNAVGVDQLGRAHFVISEEPISLGRLARYFRDVLNVDNALYLDGDVSQIWDAPTGRLDTGEPIGPLIIVRDRGE